LIRDVRQHGVGGHRTIPDHELSIQPLSPSAFCKLLDTNRAERGYWFTNRKGFSCVNC
jgi:hypothetical protein